MSMNLIRWEQQTVTPKHDSIQWDDGRCGALNGCEITHLGANKLRISSGYIVILGRLIEVSQTDVNCNVSTDGELNGQMFIRLDLGSDEPVEIVTEAAAVLTELTQDKNANYDNGVYELLLATYNISETTISNLSVKLPEIDSIGEEISSIEEDISELNNNLSTFAFKVEDGTKKVSSDNGVTWENFSSGAELIWTNSAPSSAFNAQTISLDLSKYNYLIIETRYDVTEPISQASKTIIEKGANRLIFGCYNTKYRCSRAVNSNNNSVIFESGVNYQNQSSDNACIPLNIYGTKNL